MSERLIIFRCPQCPDAPAKEFDLPAFIEHFCKVHQDGFHLFACSGCKTKFATGYRASHHMLTCDGTLIPGPSVADFGMHLELQKMIDASTRNAFSKGREEGSQVSNQPEDVFAGDSPRLYIDYQEEQDQEEQREEPRTAAVEENWPKMIPEELTPHATPPRDPRRRSFDRKDSRRMEMTPPGFARGSGSERGVKQMSVEGSFEAGRIKEEAAESKPTPERHPRKRRWDVVAPEFAQPLSGCVPSAVPGQYILPSKDMDLMNLPQFNSAAPLLPGQSMEQQMLYGYQLPAMGFPTGQPSYTGFLPQYAGTVSFPGQTPAFHSRPNSKLSGPMSLKYMDMFDIDTDYTDLTIEIEGSRGNHRMHFVSNMLCDQSPYFKRLLNNFEFREQRNKFLTLRVSLPVFIDTMNVLHGKRLPWKFECRGYFNMINLYRVYKMLKMAEMYEFDYVKKYVEKEMFTVMCGATSSCDCTGCIERVVLAKTFNLAIPPTLTFTKKAAFSWLKDCTEHSCAPELNMVAVVSAYLKPFIEGLI